MALSRQTLNRLPTIKKGFRSGQSYEEIASSCEVHHRTIERDVQSWVQSGLFEIWIKQEFIDLHGYARGNDPIEAYKQIAKIVAKMVTHKIERKTETTTEIKHEYTFKLDEMPQDEREFCIRLARRYIKANNQTRSVTIH